MSMIRRIHNRSDRLVSVRASTGLGDMYYVVPPETTWEVPDGTDVLELSVRTLCGLPDVALASHIRLKTFSDGTLEVVRHSIPNARLTGAGVNRP